jgi:GT2 family glycosyltransferase
MGIQSVLYHPETGQLDRFLQGVRAAVVMAHRCQPGLTITLNIGDCSSDPTLSSSTVDELQKSLTYSGISSFTYQPFGKNIGSAAGHNALLKESDADAIVIVNPDSYVCPDIMVELLVPFEDAAVGIVEARQIPIEHPKDFDRIDGTTSWASTACALIRHELMREIGGFDAETFFLYCDDVDLSWRARLSGYRVVHRPSARVFHDKRLNEKGILMPSHAEFYYSAEAALLMAWKYSRPDLVERWSSELLDGGNMEHRRAVEEFRRRQVESRLPEPLDPEGRVATFMGYNYARHRFGVGG